MNVLAVGAHFDDLELGCGGSLARHVRKGDRVIGFVATTSDYGGGPVRLLGISWQPGISPHFMWNTERNSIQSC